MIPVFALNAVQTVLAASADKLPDPNKVVPGAVSVFVFIFLAVSVVLLLLSFRKQLRKVDGHFQATGEGDAAEKTGGADGSRPA